MRSPPKLRAHMMSGRLMNPLPEMEHKSHLHLSRSLIYMLLFLEPAEQTVLTHGEGRAAFACSGIYNDVLLHRIIPVEEGCGWNSVLP